MSLLTDTLRRVAEFNRTATPDDWARIMAFLDQFDAIVADTDRHYADHALQALCDSLDWDTWQVMSDMIVSRAIIREKRRAGEWVGVN